MIAPRLPLALLLALIGLTAHAQTPTLGKDPIPAIIKAMTVEEKVRLVVGAGFNMPGMTNTGTGVGQTQDRVPGAAGTTHAIDRLGIPSMVTSDGPAGVRIDSTRKAQTGKTYYATAWPVATLLASSWDTALVTRVGAAFGQEVKEYGIDVILGPAMNIHRNPLGGRNFEYFSEDPLVTGKMAAAMVNGIQSNGVGVSIKHFAANNQETDRNTVNTIVSERALREIYLRGFQIAVKESQPWTVMSSYNLINGVYTSENPDLLTTILRNEWGFSGFVMTDWFGGKNAVNQINAQNNLLMPGTTAQSDSLVQAVKAGRLSEKVLDENVAGILRVMLHTPSFKQYKYSDQPDLKMDAQISREAAADGMVLLKNNDQALPIPQNLHHIALFGINGYDLIAGGTGSGDVNKAYKVSLQQGLSDAGLNVEQELQNQYTAYLAGYAAKHPRKSFIQEFMNPSPPTPEYAVPADMIAKEATGTEMAIIAIGRNAGEGRDRKVDDDYELTQIEKDGIKNIADAFHAQHKKVIVVLNIGGVIGVMPWRENADAILLAWQPGLEGGHAMADILTGKVNPSGKLATTFPQSYSDVPSAKNFPGKEFPEKATTGMFGMKITPAEVTYEEGIYVGYRYYNTFHIKPAYEFGYGLSYTNFTYSDLKLSAKRFDGSLTATVNITNTGKAPGKEVVEVYLSAPTRKLDKPILELKAFAKTNLLQPGQTQTMSFTLTANELASFNTAATAWIADAGKYTIQIGASSLDIKQTASFELPGDIVVEKDHKVLAPQTPINELKAK